MGLVSIIGLLYFATIASFFYGWKKLINFAPQNVTNYPKVSVVVPMRNEQKRISGLLNDLKKQDYPGQHFEVIVIDDHSADESLSQANLYTASNCRVISLPDTLSGKKAAIHYGIENCTGEIILTTDADCRVHPQWIRTFITYFELNEPVLAFGPVIAEAPDKPFEKIQSLELFSLLGSTAGSAAIGFPVMCNGANMGFRKKLFSHINHLYQNPVVQSGDDIFVLLEVKKLNPRGVHFIKSEGAAVLTQVASSVKSFFEQRGRWVSKARFYRDPTILLVAFIVFAVNVALVATLLYGIFTGNFLQFLVLLGFKSLVDFPFLFSVTTFFGKNKLMAWFPIVQSIYFLYVCTSIIVAFIMPLGWKGRKL